MKTQSTDRTNLSPPPHKCACVYWARTDWDPLDEKELLRHHLNCQHRYHPTVNKALKGSAKLQEKLQLEFLLWWRQLTLTAQREVRQQYQNNPIKTAWKIYYTISYKKPEVFNNLSYKKGLTDQHLQSTILYSLKSTGVIEP